MNFMFFIYIPLVHSASHKFMTTCKGINGQAAAGIPEFSAKTTLDGQQIDYYDSDTETLIPKQDWMKKFASTDRWKKYTDIRERVQQTNKINITLLMEQFSQTHGVHMYQRKYGCVWHKTEDSDGFDQYSYDGQTVISLDLKEDRYTALVPQAEPTVMKWNNDKEQFDFLKQYYKHECIDWLKEILNFSRTTFKKTGIASELPGKSLPEPIQNNLTKNDTKSCKCTSGLYIKLSVCLILVISMTTLCVHWKLKGSKCCKKRVIYGKIYPFSNPSDKPASEQRPMVSSE